VRDEAAAKAAVQLAVDTFGRLDVLVNNAGYGQFAPFEQMSAENFQAIVDTCFYGVVYTTRAAVPVMRKQKSGHIFQVSSVGGRHAPAERTSQSPGLLQDGSRGKLQYLHSGGTPRRPNASPAEICPGDSEGYHSRAVGRRGELKPMTVTRAVQLQPTKKGEY
jgi:NAD(P)-dependent dehydrogenase (short-subunit alcohol dehydrogenase family)